VTIQSIRRREVDKAPHPLATAGQFLNMAKLCGTLRAKRWAWEPPATPFPLGSPCHALHLLASRALWRGALGHDMVCMPRKRSDIPLIRGWLAMLLWLTSS
jgi:hypothetical protein